MIVYWDWTTKDDTSNTSETFEELCIVVERLIADDAHSLINDGPKETARLIVAHLAHKYKMIPTLTAEEIRKIRVK